MKALISMDMKALISIIPIIKVQIKSTLLVTAYKLKTPVSAF
jgi:hypothetical protein